MLLHDFIDENREELIRRIQEKAVARLTPKSTDDELKRGIPVFLDQLSAMLGAAIPETTGQRRSVPSESATGVLMSSAREQGGALFKRGFSVDQVVHDYGNLCQAVTELATEKQALISTEDFHVLNRCLDEAIAAAVTEHTRAHDNSLANYETQRLGFLAHELRNLITAGILSYRVLRSGAVGFTSKTAEMHERVLQSLRTIIDRAMTEVRMEARILHEELLCVADVIDDVGVTAAIDAASSGRRLEVQPGDATTAVYCDRELLTSALANLTQNAIKYSHAGGLIRIVGREVAGRVLIEVEDECGGLPEGLLGTQFARPQPKRTGEFQPFADQEGGDRSGLGLGLSISEKAVKESHGSVHVKDRPGYGCVFTIDLPQAKEASHT